MSRKRSECARELAFSALFCGPLFCSKFIHQCLWAPIARFPHVLFVIAASHVCSGGVHVGMNSETMQPIRITARAPTSCGNGCFLNRVVMAHYVLGGKPTTVK